MAYNPGKDRNMIASLKRVMEKAWFGAEVAGRAQAPDILNGEYLIGLNAAGTGTVNLLGLDASDRPVFGAAPPAIPNGSYLTGLNAAGNGTVNLIGVDSSNNVVLGAGYPMPFATVNLTAANLLGMEVTPVQILPAPGAGKAILVTQVLFEITTTATQFANGGAASLVYHGGSVPVHAGSIPAATITAGAGSTNTLLGMATGANGTVVPANTGVDITNADAPFITGTGTAKVKIWYTIVTL